MFKKLMYVGIGALLTVVILGVAGFAYAQTQTPPSTFGPGMMGGSNSRGGMMGRGGMLGGQSGLLHDYMISAWAEAFDMSVEDLQARLDAGDTMWTVAEEKGLTQEEFFTLMQDVRTKALATAVDAGVITQDQADWMLSRMSQMWQNGGGRGPCHGGAGRWTQPSAPVQPAG